MFCGKMIAIMSHQRKSGKETTMDAKFAGSSHYVASDDLMDTAKDLLLMDSGGSMDYYAGLCSMPLQAAAKFNHLRASIPTTSITAFP